MSNNAILLSVILALPMLFALPLTYNLLIAKDECETATMELMKNYRPGSYNPAEKAAKAEMEAACKSMDAQAKAYARMIRSDK